MEAPPRTFFATNLKCVEFVDPELAERITAASSATVTLVPTSSGAPTATAKRADGVEAHLHSAVDPRTEARRYAAALKVEGEAVAVVGLGLGYHVLEIARALPKDKWLLVIESREDIARAALEAVDLTDALRRPRTRLFFGADYVAFLDWLKAFLNESAVDTLSVLRHPTSFFFEPEFYRQLQIEMESAVTRRKVEVATLIAFAGQLETNAIRNLPPSFDAVALAKFKDLFKGRPGVLVAAGPSLNEALPALAGVDQRAVVVAVDKCTKLLLSRGIPPHVTALLDMTEATKDFYADFKPDPTPLLVYDPDAYHETVARYPGPRITFETVVPWTRWLAKLGGPNGFLEKGISVAHTAFFFLREAGADPIILVGVDLAFPGARTHADGVVMNWGGDVTPKMAHEVMLASVKGGTVRSVIAFQTFVTVFEILISQTKTRVINTSPEGALLRGAVNMPLAEALAAHAKEPFDVRAALGRVLGEHRPPDWAAFRDAAGRVLRGVRDILREGEEGLRILRRFRRLDMTNRLDREEYGRQAKRINPHRLAILQAGETLSLLQRAVAGDAVKVKEITKKMKEAADKPDVFARLDVERMEAFFGAYVSAARLVENSLDAAVAEAKGR